MAYISQSDFTAYTPSTIMDPAEFAELAERASDVIDMLTMHRIPRGGGLSALAAEVQTAVKKATCAQVQTLQAQGSTDALTGNAAVPGATLGKFSYYTAQGTDKTTTPTINGIPYSPLIAGYLSTTGLLYRGLG